VVPQPWAATTFPVVPSRLWQQKMNAIPAAGAGDDEVKKLAGVPTLVVTRDDSTSAVVSMSQTAELRRLHRRSALPHTHAAIGRG